MSSLDSSDHVSSFSSSMLGGQGMVSASRCFPLSMLGIISPVLVLGMFPWRSSMLVHEAGRKWYASELRAVASFSEF